MPVLTLAPLAENRTNPLPLDMPVNARTKRLVTKAHQFALHKAKGATNTDAWRMITPKWQKMPLPQQHTAAYEFANNPIVKQQVNEMLRHVSVSVLDSHGRYHNELIEDVDTARKDGNMTAVAALQRIRGISASLLAEKITVSDDRPQLKADLAKLEQLDPASAAWFRSKLGMGTDAEQNEMRDSNAAAIQPKSLN